MFGGHGPGRVIGRPRSSAVTVGVNTSVLVHREQWECALVEGGTARRLEVGYRLVSGGQQARPLLTGFYRHTRWCVHSKGRGCEAECNV